MSNVSILKQSDIFFELTSTQLELIAALCHEQRCKIGEVIFEENSKSKELYIIGQGEVEIQLDPNLVGDGSVSPGRPARPFTIATLRRGQSFGEVALVDQGLRSASARCAQQNTRLLVIPRDKLMSMCETYPLLGFRLMRNLAADLAMKTRNADLRIRGELLYAGRR